jgi:hypothetical protein
MIWIVVGILVALVSAWVLCRKRVAGVPLVVGLVLLYGFSLALVMTYPPSAIEVLALAFVLGLSIALIAWGIANYVAERIIDQPFHVEKKYDEKSVLMVSKEAKRIYGVFYGWVPWSDVGASYFANFLNEVVWVKGYKVAFMDVAEIEIGGQPWAFIWGIVLPKTVIDRILY